MLSFSVFLFCFVLFLFLFLYSLKSLFGTRIKFVCMYVCMYMYTSQLKYVFRLEENESKLTNSPRRTNLLTPYENNNLNFQLAREICCTSRRQPNNFFAVCRYFFELEGITEHLMTGPAGKSEFWKQNKTHCFPWGRSLSA